MPMSINSHLTKVAKNLILFPSIFLLFLSEHGYLMRFGGPDVPRQICQETQEGVQFLFSNVVTAQESFILNWTSFLVL